MKKRGPSCRGHTTHFGYGRRSIISGVHVISTDEKESTMKSIRQRQRRPESNRFRRNSPGRGFCCSLCLATVAVLLVHQASLRAAEISWEIAQGVMDPTVVRSDNAWVEAINASPNAGAVTVHGVTFESSNALLPNPGYSGALVGAETLDPGLDELLNTFDYGGGTSTSITIGGDKLVIGQSYIVQVFYTDLRFDRVMFFGDAVGNTVGLHSSGGIGQFGETVVGTFTADATTQTLNLAINTGNTHITAYQIRSAIALPVIESFTVTPVQIASGETTTLSWQISNADSARIDAGVGPINATTGRTTVSPTTTTTYTLSASNEGGTVTAQLSIGVDGARQEPVLNEFLASNDANLLDAQGNSSDWIEIYNPNVFAIDLAGYFLSDDPSDPVKWAFPDETTIAGQGYRVVFASGTSQGLPELHTNFAISAQGGSLMLVAPDGSTALDEFMPYPEQHADVSYGVAAGSEGYFPVATPGAENGSAFLGFVANTAFDRGRGFYEDPFTVTISTPTLGATIVHTIDGSEPTLTNGMLTPPAAANRPGAIAVAITKTTVLRAAAFKADRVSTPINTQTYLFTANIIEQPAMDPDIVHDPLYGVEMDPAFKSIRSLSIATDPDNLFDSAIGILANTQGRGIHWERPVSIEFIDPYDPQASFQTNAGLRVHGNGSRSNPKNSMRLLFRGDYGAKKLKYPLFDYDWVAQRFNTVVLRAQNANSWTSSRSLDRTSTTFLQDTFAKDTQGAMGHPTGGSTFVHLFLNGSYWGLYNPTERPDGSFGEDHFGGDDADYDAVNRRFSVEVLSGTKTVWDEMIAHADSLLDSPAENEKLADYIDVDNLIDYMLIHQFMQTRDGPDDFGHNNMRLVRRNEPPGPFRAYVWDMEYSMIDALGTRDYSYPFPIYSSTRNSNNDISDSIAAVYIRLKDNNAEFQLRYADRAFKHLYNGGALSTEKATARFLARADEIMSAVICESARWGDQRRSTPYTRDVEWMAERNRILDEFFPARPDHVVSQLRRHGLYPSIDPPAFNQHGGKIAPGFQLTMTTPTGIPYYTLDGSDPREPADPRDVAPPVPPATLISEAAFKLVYVPIAAGDGMTDSRGTTWNALGHDDSTWISGFGGVGYETGNGYQTLFEIDTESLMRNRTTSCLIRIPFTVAAGDLTDRNSVHLHVRYDDGYVAYLNGFEIARANFTGVPNGSSNADSNHSDGSAMLLQAVDVSHHFDLLNEGGENVLAIHALNVSTASSDFLLSAELRASATFGTSTGGTVSASAIPYDNPVSINKTTQVRARVFDGTDNWSAVNEAIFMLDPRVNH